MNILFENEDFILAVKPSGVSSEEGMRSLLSEHWGKDDAYVGTVSRLDRAVGGVMVFGKNKTATGTLSKLLLEGKLKKEYICLCAGEFSEKHGEMEDYLFKDSGKNKVFPVKSQRKGAKYAKLFYIVERELKTPEGETVSMCRVRLATGRTHQIRVQFASRKHPLAGDGKYGSRLKGDVALWCEKIFFPWNGESLTFSAPPEWSWNKILQK